MAIKILHTADWHIGANMQSFGAVKDRRKAELLLSLKNIAELCNRNNIDLWLIAGDLFDSNFVSKEDCSVVKSAFASAPNTKVAIVPGNHDFLSSDSPYMTDFPENVFIFKESGYFDFSGVRIWGVPFTSSHSDTFSLPTATDGMANILLLHADTDGGMYNPVTPALLGRTNMDYIALGHIHKKTPVLCENGVCYAYPGSPESHGFDEVGEMGVYIGTVEKGRVNLEFVPTAIRNCVNLSADLTDTADINEAAAVVESTVKSHSQNAVRVTLTGSTDYEVNTEYIKTALENSVFALRIKDKTVPSVNIDLIRKENTLCGYFCDMMCEKIESAQKENADSEKINELENALRLGLSAFCGRGVNYNED